MGKVGQGMKPRGQKKDDKPVEKQVEVVPEFVGTAGDQEVHPVDVEMPTTEGQPESIIKPVLERQEQEQKGRSLDPEKVQNLDSPEESKTAISVADEGEAEAKPATIVDSETDLYLSGSDPLAAALDQSRVEIPNPRENMKIERFNQEQAEGRANRDDGMTRVSSAGVQSVAVGGGYTIKAEMLDEMTGKVKIYSLGDQPDGTHNMLVKIQEGYIEPIRQWAEQDGKTPEEWVTDALASYLETWSQPAAKR